jgi:hypothetical protein
MGLDAMRGDAGELGPLVVLLCETETVVRAWPGDTRRKELAMRFVASDPNPLAQATSALRETWGEGHHIEVATRAMQWWAWRPVGRVARAL